MAERNLTLTATAPAFDGVSVTPSDVTLLTNPGDIRCFYVGVTGDISVQMESGAVVFKNVAVGYHPLKGSRINSTGTTATEIIALY